MIRDIFLDTRPTMGEPDVVVKSEAMKKSVSENDVRDAWNACHPYAGGNTVSAPTDMTRYVQDILVDESAVVVHAGPDRFMVPFRIADGEVVFDEGKATRVRQAWKPVGKSHDAWLADPGHEDGGPVVKVWSPESRVAAAEARRRNARNFEVAPAPIRHRPQQGGESTVYEPNAAQHAEADRRQRNIARLPVQNTPADYKHHLPVGTKIVDLKVQGGPTLTGKISRHGKLLGENHYLLDTGQRTPWKFSTNGLHSRLRLGNGEIQEGAVGKSEGDDVVKVWPDEARAAALEGRRGKKYPGNPAREGSDAARRDGEARTVWDARHGVAVVTKPKPKAKSEDDVVKVWSPESRAAALEARRRNARGQSGKVPFGRQNVKANSAALEQYGWKQVTDPGTAMFDFQTFEHSKYPGHQITMSNKDGRWNAGKDPKPGGEGWTPVGGGKGSIKTYLDSFSTYTPKDKEDGKMKSQRPPGPRVVEDDEDVVKVWSDASRAAAAEARRRGARRQGAGVLTPREPVRPSQKPGYRYKPGPGGLRPPRPTRFDPSNLP